MRRQVRPKGPDHNHRLGIGLPWALSSFILKREDPNAELVLLLPEFDQYRNMYLKAKWALKRLGIAVMFVKEDGKVSV